VRHAPCRYSVCLTGKGISVRTLLPVRYAIDVQQSSYREGCLYTHSPPCKTRHIYTVCVCVCLQGGVCVGTPLVGTPLVYCTFGRCESPDFRYVICQMYGTQSVTVWYTVHLAGVKVDGLSIVNTVGAAPPPTIASLLTGHRSGQKLASDRPNLCMQMHHHFWRNIALNESVHLICKACISMYLITDCDLLKDVEARWDRYQHSYTNHRMFCMGSLCEDCPGLLWGSPPCKMRHTTTVRISQGGL
jgi:hypothetical protein